MVVLRNDARRRRLVVDPSQTTSVGESESAGAQEQSPNQQANSVPADVRGYSFSADRRNHHKTTDLIPKRVVSYLLVVLVMLACLGLLNYGSFKSPDWESQIGADGVQSLAIHGRGSLASWFSSFLLIMTGLASLQIYALRQHRCDDYRGTYRLWIWMAALFIVASINCVVNLGGILSHLFETVTSSTMTQRPWLLIAIKISALTLLVARGLFEVRESRGSLAWVVLVWLGYSAAALMQLPSVNESLTDLGPDMMVGNCVLFATAALVMAHLNYARFVFFQAHGLIKPKVKQQKVAKPKAAVKPKIKRKKKAKPKVEIEISDESESLKPKLVVASSDEVKKAKPRRTKVVKTKATKKVAKPSPKIKPESKPEPKPEIKGGTSGNGKSAQDVLKELAAASRAKQQVSPEPESYEDDYETEGVIKMSKAQRRKQRKSERTRKRAA